MRCAEKFSEPGVYTVKYRFNYSLLPREKTWIWPDKSRRFPLRLIPRRRRPAASEMVVSSYGEASDIPVTIRVVDPDEANRLETEADREFDAEVEAALGENP